jgi:peptidoglycan hydrolase-like protein with peptidoglycan-binding domain
MHSCVWWARSAAFAISLCALPADADAAGAMVQLAQNASDAGQPPAADAPANSPEQIKKAQVELKRLECLKGRVDGKLGEQTRQAVLKYRASAKQPAGEVVITDDFITELAGRGDLYCRPPRPFFGFGARPGGFLPPGVRPIPVPPAAVRPAPPAAEP